MKEKELREKKKIELSKSHLELKEAKSVALNETKPLVGQNCTSND